MLYLARRDVHGARFQLDIVLGSHNGCSTNSVQQGHQAGSEIFAGVLNDYRWRAIGWKSDQQAAQGLNPACGRADQYHFFCATGHGTPHTICGGLTRGFGPARGFHHHVDILHELNWMIAFAQLKNASPPVKQWVRFACRHSYGTRPRSDAARRPAPAAIWPPQPPAPPAPRSAAYPHPCG